MKVNLAHLRERATNGGWINFAVFDARSTSGSTTDNANLLSRLTAKAQAASLRVDQAALAFVSNGRIQFFGSRSIVDFLSKRSLPNWTHHIDV